MLDFATGPRNDSLLSKSSSRSYSSSYTPTSKKKIFRKTLPLKLLSFEPLSSESLSRHSLSRGLLSIGYLTFRVEDDITFISINELHAFSV